MPTSALCQAAGMHMVSAHCPVQATRITPRVYAFRLYAEGEEGWRPVSKMALDLRVKNESDRGIAAMSFQITAPHRSLINEWENVLVNVNPGEERTIYYPTDGRIIDLYRDYTSVSVILTKIRYADGEIVDFDCDLGSSITPPPFKPEKPASPSKIYSIGGEVSPPRILESHAMDTREIPHPCSRSEVSENPRAVCCATNTNDSCTRNRMTVRLSAVIEVDGSPQDIKVESGTLGEKLNNKAIETLRMWNFAPAMMDDKPVATRVFIPFIVDWYGPPR